VGSSGMVGLCEELGPTALAGAPIEGARRGVGKPPPGSRCCWG
jgi:hypothetical protein